MEHVIDEKKATEAKVIHLKPKEKESLFDSILKKPYITEEDKLKLDIENQEDKINFLKSTSKLTEILLKLELGCKDVKIKNLQDQLNLYNRCWQASIRECNLLRSKAAKLRRQLKECKLKCE